MYIGKRCCIKLFLNEVRERLDFNKINQTQDSIWGFGYRRNEKIMVE